MNIKKFIRIDCKQEFCNICKLNMFCQKNFDYQCKKTYDFIYGSEMIIELDYDELYILAKLFYEGCNILKIEGFNFNKNKFDMLYRIFDKLYRDKAFKELVDKIKLSNELDKILS